MNAGLPQRITGPATRRSSEPQTFRHLPADGGPTPRTITLLTAVVFACIGATAIYLAIVIDAPATARADTGSENEAIARRFYAAINYAVRTGDLPLLERVAEIDANGTQASTEMHCDLRCRVGALHRLAPGVRLEVDEVLIDGNRVAARLSVEGNDRPTFLGLPLSGDLAPWGEVDFLRVDDGQIVEVQRADDLPALVEPLGRTALDHVPTAPYRLGLVRLTLEPDATIPELTAKGPVFLLVESGTLVVSVDQPALVQRAGPARDSDQEELMATGEIVLSPGERITMVAGMNYALCSTGNEVASVLSAAMLVGDGGPTNRWVRARSVNEILFKPREPESVAQTSTPTRWPPGVRSELIADGVIETAPGASATLDLARLTLPLNAVLPVHETPGAELIAVESGAAIVDLGAGDGAMRPRSHALRSRIWPQGGGSVRDPRITQGGSAVLQPEASAGVRNIGDEPLALLILTLDTTPG